MKIIQNIPCCIFYGRKFQSQLGNNSLHASFFKLGFIPDLRRSNETTFFKSKYVITFFIPIQYSNELHSIDVSRILLFTDIKYENKVFVIELAVRFPDCPFEQEFMDLSLLNDRFPGIGSTVTLIWLAEFVLVAVFWLF